MAYREVMRRDFASVHTTSPYGITEHDGPKLLAAAAKLLEVANPGETAKVIRQLYPDTDSINDVTIIGGPHIILKVMQMLGDKRSIVHGNDVLTLLPPTFRLDCEEVMMQVRQLPGHMVAIMILLIKRAIAFTTVKYSFTYTETFTSEVSLLDENGNESKVLEPHTRKIVKTMTGIVNALLPKRIHVNSNATVLVVDYAPRCSPRDPRVTESMLPLLGRQKLLKSTDYTILCMELGVLFIHIHSPDVAQYLNETAYGKDYHHVLKDIVSRGFSSQYAPETGEILRQLVQSMVIDDAPPSLEKVLETLETIKASLPAAE